MLAEASLLVALSVQRGAGTDDCLAQSRLQRGVERRLRRKVFVDEAQAALRFVVRFERRGAEVEARITITSADGTSRGSRTLVTSNHCSSLDDSLALSLALLVDQPPDPEPEPAPAPEPKPLDSPSPPAPSPPPRAVIEIPPDVVAPREPWHVSAGLGAASSFGVLPGLAPALTAWLGVTPRRLVPVTLRGEWFFARRAERDSGSGAEFRLLRAELRVCPTVVENEARELGVCVGQRLGWLRVAGYGFDHDLAEGRLTFALGLGAVLRQRLVGPVSLRAYLGVEVPVVRDRFTSAGENGTELFRAAPLALGGELGVEARVW